MSDRICWDHYFMLMAKIAASRTTCFSDPKGAIIVVNKNIVSTGYNGAPSGAKDCKYGYGECYKRKLGFGHGTGHHVCKASHAEANAIIQAAKNGIAINGGTLYSTHKPCHECAKLIVNSGIKKIYYLHDYAETDCIEMFNETGIRCIHVSNFDLDKMLSQIK